MVNVVKFKCLVVVVNFVKVMGMVVIVNEVNGGSGGGGQCGKNDGFGGCGQ